MSQIRRWLDNCERFHKECRPSGPPVLPRRLICIEDPSRASGIKVRDVHELLQNTAKSLRYLTLSHCWGKNPAAKPIELLRSNLHGLEKSVMIDAAHKTFIQAINLTKALGFDYIWIDSLCIIQDDSEDKQQEISRMHLIYRGADANLVADAANDGSEGLFKKPAFRDQIALATVRPRWRTNDSPGSPWVVVGRYQDSVYHNGTTARRAWCVQERLLARRLIQFTKEQVLWQCRRTKACQIFPFGVPANYPGEPEPGADLDLPSVVERIGSELIEADENTWNSTCQWAQFVKLFTVARLTEVGDRLRAMAGVVGQICDRHPELKGQYVGGLWKCYLPQAMLWKKRQSESSLAPRDRAPSWSWTGLECAIDPASLARNTVSVSRVIDIETKGADLADRLVEQTGRVLIEGPMADLCFIKGEGGVAASLCKLAGSDKQMVLLHGVNAAIPRRIELLEGTASAELHFDWDGNRECLTNLVMLIISTDRRRHENLQALVLKHLSKGAKHNIYRRIGVVQLFRQIGDHSLFDWLQRDLDFERVEIH